ncbi:hypothetical protein YPPY01_1248, partial [Yersinia pestis PY-01]
MLGDILSRFNHLNGALRAGGKYRAVDAVERFNRCAAVKFHSPRADTPWHADTAFSDDIDDGT